MAENEEREEATSRGNGWEVVSLTSSAYAAAPGPELADANDVVGQRIEKNDAMFLSGHFVFPPSQHENLPLEPEEDEVQNIHEIGESFSSLDREEEPDEFDEGIIEKQQSMNTDSKFSSFYSETIRYDENTFIPGQMEPSEGLSDSQMLNSSNNGEDDDEYDISKIPCEAWWKRGANSLYTQAKEANTFWSLFVAAAVVGLVVLGRRLHREKFEVLQRLSLDSEKVKKTFGPISRLKAFVEGGSHRGSGIHVGSSIGQ